MKVLSFLLLFKDNETIAYMDPKVIVSAHFFITLMKYQW